MDVTYVHVKVGETAATECVLPQRYFLRDEIEAALMSAGFSSVEVFGDFSGRAYADDSELMVVEARA